MARASRIWTVQDTREGNRCVGAFTVKHELASWLQRKLVAVHLPHLAIYVHSDGNPWSYVHLGTAAAFLDGHG